MLHGRLGWDIRESEECKYQNEVAQRTNNIINLKKISRNEVFNVKWSCASVTYHHAAASSIDLVLPT